MILPIQLISTDFDGTIYAEFENPPVPASLQELIAQLQARGAKWVINTGRDLTSLMEAMARARLVVRPDYLVLVEREIYHHEGAQYVGLAEWNRRCTEDHARLFGPVRQDLPRLTAWVAARYDATVYEDPWSPFCLLAKSNADADAIHAYLADYCLEVPHLTVVRNDVYARFSHVAYNKGTALAEIARRLGIAPRFIFAAGDHLNDLPMLASAHAGWLMAPANAVPAVKEAVRRQGGEVSALARGAGVEAALRGFLERAAVSPGGLNEEMRNYKRA